MLSLGPSFRLVSWVYCQGGRHASTPHAQGRLYLGAQVVLVEHRDAPAAFTL